MMNLKKCNSCKKDKPLTDYYKSSRGAGKRGKCSECMRAEAKAIRESNIKKKEGFYSSQETMKAYGFKQMNVWDVDPFINHVQHIKKTK